MKKFRGWAKTRQPFLAVSGPKFTTNLEACRGVTVDWQVSYQLLISCSVAEICWVKVWSRSPKLFFCPLAHGGKCPVKFGPNFSNSSHNWICVQVWLRSVQWPQRLGIEKKKQKEKNHSGKIYALQHCNAMRAHDNSICRLPWGPKMQRRWWRWRVTSYG